MARTLGRYMTPIFRIGEKERRQFQNHWTGTKSREHCNVTGTDLDRSKPLKVEVKLNKSD